MHRRSIELPFQDGPGFDWFPDSKSFHYDYDVRGYKAKELRVVDATTGEQKILVREQSDSYRRSRRNVLSICRGHWRDSLVLGA